MSPIISRAGFSFGFGRRRGGASGPSFSATGGTVTTAAGKTIHTFTGSGTFTVTSGSGTVDYLVVAGGGGGAWSRWI